MARSSEESMHTRRILDCQRAKRKPPSGNQGLGLSNSVPIPSGWLATWTRYSLYAYNRHSWLNGNIAIIGKICQETLADTAGNPACDPESRREECSIELLFHVCPSTACEYAIEQIHIERDDYGSDQDYQDSCCGSVHQSPHEVLPAGKYHKGNEC